MEGVRIYKGTSSISSGVIQKGGLIVIVSPETRTSIPYFSHTSPKYAATPGTFNGTPC